MPEFVVSVSQQGAMRMPNYSIDGVEPEFPSAGEFWVAPNAVLIGRIRLKRDASIWFGSILRGDNELIEIGERSNIQEACVCHADPGYPLIVGDDCTIGHQVMLHGCIIGSGSLVGMCATILNGAKIGRNCLIGAKALIAENKVIPDNSLVMGAPGRVVRELDEAAIAGVKRGTAQYVQNWRRFAKGLRPVA
jgi:carbonic anhydrase/acetyltransferase-like protein (isoleucine patch superfamily)